MNKPAQDTVLVLTYSLGNFNLTTIANLCSFIVNRVIMPDDLSEDSLLLFQKMYCEAIGLVIVGKALYNPTMFQEFTFSTAEVAAFENTLIK